MARRPSSPGAPIAVFALTLILSALGAMIWQSALRPTAPVGGGTKSRVERLPGLSLAVPDVPIVEVAPEALAGRLVVADARVRVHVAWSEGPVQATPEEALREIQRAWLSAARPGARDPLTPGPAVRVAGHEAVTRLGLEGTRHVYALTWECLPSRRMLHALVTGESGADVPGIASRLAGDSQCHAGAAPATAAGPRTALPETAGFRVVRTGSTRRAYSGPGGAIDVIVEEGPSPSGDPVAHVMGSPALWPALLTGIVGRTAPVEQPGARQVADLAHRHPAVRVHGRLQPEPTVGGPLAPILFVETTIWLCPASQRLVSVSAVTPDRRVLERARPFLDGARCH